MKTLILRALNIASFFCAVLGLTFVIVGSYSIIPAIDRGWLAVIVVVAVLSLASLIVCALTGRALEV